MASPNVHAFSFFHKSKLPFIFLGKYEVLHMETLQYMEAKLAIRRGTECTPRNLWFSVIVELRHLSAPTSMVNGQWSGVMGVMVQQNNEGHRFPTACCIYL